MKKPLFRGVYRNICIEELPESSFLPLTTVAVDTNGWVMPVLFRSGNNWYIAGANADREPLKLTFRLPFTPSGTGNIITEGETIRSFSTTTVTPGPDGETTVEMQPNGGFVIKF